MMTAHLLLPVLHWLNPRESMGELRARVRKA